MLFEGGGRGERGLGAFCLRSQKAKSSSREKSGNSIPAPAANLSSLISYLLVPPKIHFAAGTELLGQPKQPEQSELQSNT